MMKETPTISTNDVTVAPTSGGATPVGATPVAQPLPPRQIAPAPSTPPQTVFVPVAVQPGAVQPGMMAPAPAPAPEVMEVPESAPAHPDHKLPREIRIYSHSTLFYWWPVWAVGYLMALLTWMWGHMYPLGSSEVLVSESKNLGVIFTLTVLLVILITNVTLRGMASVVTILVGIITVLTLAYFGVWRTLLHTLGQLEIFMNFGFYVFFSTAVFLVWAFAFFFYDRMTYWRFRPGQVTQETVIGGAEHTYDTRGMVFVKHREDLFRHWVLGLGSGDIEFSTTGARRENVYIPNVLFVNSRLHDVQRMIVISPDTETPVS